MRLELKRHARSETTFGIMESLSEKPTSAFGNCVSVGKYHLRNISAENLRRWERETGATWVEIEEVGTNIAEIVDERVPDEYLREHECAICVGQAVLGVVLA